MDLPIKLVNNNVDVRRFLRYIIAMAKNSPIGVRLSPEERAELEAWASEDDRPLSALLRKIIADRLKARRANET